MKKLGFGLMRLPLKNPNDEKSIDIEKTKEMVDIFLKRGFSYFDTAWMYCGFESENAVKTVLTSRYPRGAYTLATKLHARFLSEKTDCEKIFSTQLEKTGVSYFDYYLLHDVKAEYYEIFNKFDAFNWLIDKKKKGYVKEIGFSFHDKADFLDKVLTEHPEMDFVQLQVNYIDWENEVIQSKKCVDTAIKHNKKIIVMEPVKGGTLANLPMSAEKLFKHNLKDMSAPSWAIRFAAGIENVFMVLSGMSNIEQVLDNTDYMMDFKPLNNDELKIVKEAADIINSSVAIPCTACSYCVGQCPQKIAIPEYFSLYNSEKREFKEKDWTPQGEYYRNLIKVSGAPDDCINCKSCEMICPQHLPVREYLKAVADEFKEN